MHVHHFPDAESAQEFVGNDSRRYLIVFSSIAYGADLNDLEYVATIREREGITVVVKEATAKRHQLPILFRPAWITLHVHSDLQAVGLPPNRAKALLPRGWPKRRRNPYAPPWLMLGLATVSCHSNAHSAISALPSRTL